MIEGVADGWRILISEKSGSPVFFDNRPLVEEAKAEGRGDPEFLHFAIPEAEVTPRAHILHQTISMKAYDRARTLIRERDGR